MEAVARDIVAELLDLVHSGAPLTDIMLGEGDPVMVKLPGGWEAIDSMFPPAREDMDQLIKNLDLNWEDTIVEKAINRPFDLSHWRLRINAYLAYGGSKVMAQIRRMPLHPPPLQSTGLPPSVRLMADAPRGLLLISGATGSGKSTSMAAIVDSINETRNSHIITIEDPIEYVFERKRAIFSQREVGLDTKSYFDGVRDAMRQCPNVIVIGEIRDRDTAETALLAGESGHLVIGTLHANSAVSTIQKMLGFFGAQERDAKAQTLASSLVGVISQVLLPKADRSGYALASELLFNHKQQVSHLLTDPNKLASAMDRREDGVSRTMSDSLLELISAGAVAKADALRAVAHAQGSIYDKLRNAA